MTSGREAAWRGRSGRVRAWAGVEALETLERFAFRLSFKLLDRSIAFAGSILQFLVVQDFHMASSVLDKPSVLQNSCGYANARASRTEHGPEKLMGKGQPHGADAVLAHEQPPRKALVSLMKPIASRDLRYPQRLEVYITVQSMPKIGS